ncbi:VENN motif pre-toxin domain-containing protein, partial [Serratia odorifera]
LAGGNMAQALSGAAAPYLAEQIHQLAPDEASRAMAHAVVGAVTAYASGNSAAAGATGAVSGELMAQLVLERLYPGKKVSELSESEKQAISALGTLAAGLAGGVVGDSTADAVAGAQTGKNSAENNNLANVLAAAEKSKPGTIEKYEADKQSEIAKACSGGTPVSCQAMVAAAGTALAGPLLPGAALVTGGIGGGANAGIQYLANGEINPNDVIIATWIGAATAGTGFWGTVAANGVGGATSSYIKGDDPLQGGLINGAAAGLGYGAGKLTQGASDKVINPNWKNWEWVDMGMGISKPMPLDPLPGVLGNMGGSASTEYINDRLGKSLSDNSGDKK